MRKGRNTAADVKPGVAKPRVARRSVERGDVCALAFASMSERRKRGCLGTLTTGALVIVVLGFAVGVVERALMTPEERAKHEAELEERRAERELQVAERELKAEESAAERNRRRAAQREQEAARRASQEALDKQRGFHCLSTWNGSHIRLVQAVKRQLDDPGSFKHDRTQVTPVDEAGRHSLVMSFRSKNEYGALVLHDVEAVYRNRDCSVVTWDFL